MQIMNKSLKGKKEVKFLYMLKIENAGWGGIFQIL